MIRRLVDKTSAVACVLILLGYIFAGLSPFHASSNAVRWLLNENGIRIRGKGVLWSDRSFTFNGSVQGGCSIEIWLQPANNRGSSTILEFYQSDPLRQFIIRQNGNSQLQLLKADPSGFHVMQLEHTFFPGKRTFIAVTSDALGTTLYLNSAPVKTSVNFGLQERCCSGQLILGAAAISYDNWDGDLFGIAIFNSSLTEAQMLRHYEAWNSEGQLQSTQTENAAAIYTFGERRGSIVHNEIAGEPDLYIPTRFQIPGHPFMENPWKEFQSGGVGWKDVFINIAGFIPFGFFLFSYLLSTRLNNRAGFVAIIVGALVSLITEVLQWYLPTRSSSSVDVITNIFGTALGILLYRLIFRTRSAQSPR